MRATVYLNRLRFAEELAQLMAVQELSALKQRVRSIRCILDHSANDGCDILSVNRDGDVLPMPRELLLAEMYQI